MAIQRASLGVYEVFNSKVHVPAFAGRVVIGGENVYFGIPFKEVRSALECGRRSFDDDYTHWNGQVVSAENMVTLYCHTIMKRHFFEARANFKMHKNYLRKLLTEAANVVVIDVGCGPGTAGLAFADCFQDVVFNYFGVDSAKVMREKCWQILNAAQGDGVLNTSSTIQCEASWDDVPSDFEDDTVVILGFSYFFASKTLDDATLDSLADFYNELAQNNKVVIAYTNSVDERAAENYGRFLDRLGIDYFDDPPVETYTEFYTKAYDDDTNDAKFTCALFEIE